MFSLMEEEPQFGSSLRKRILASVGAVVLLSLLGSTLSVFKIRTVSHSLDAINRVSVPLGGMLTQLRSDAEILGREMERKIGYANWNNPHWRPQPMPHWIRDVLENQIDRIRALLKTPREWAPAEVQKKWLYWGDEIATGLENLKLLSTTLYEELNRGDYARARETYPRWSAALGTWVGQIEWAGRESKRLLRQSFRFSEQTVSQLRTGLQIILTVVVLLSFLLLWLGERTLRPLADLTRLARQISHRGLRKEDKAALPDFPLTRQDEVSQLAREFRNMATALLEREKTVELQKKRLKEQNRLLHEIGALNKNILDSIESAIIVTDLDGRIKLANPTAVRWLHSPAEDLQEKLVYSFELVKNFLTHPREIHTIDESQRIEPRGYNGGYYGCHLMSLKGEDGKMTGLILIIEDVSEQIQMQRKLQIAENLAAVGRLSAQVAHEVRNPLHSIGLEAELALENTESSGAQAPSIKQSLLSILAGVERLEKITENYLRLSRPTAETNAHFHLSQVLESVLATYSTSCEEAKIRVDWELESGISDLLYGDAQLFEQALGNLMTNAIQAAITSENPKIQWKMGNTESGKLWLQVRDNGPGVQDALIPKLFTPFFTTRAQGTGLGLPFVQKVVHEHEGSIQYRADPNGGACFEMMLPLVRAAHLKTPNHYRSKTHGKNSLSG